MNDIQGFSNFHDSHIFLAQFRDSLTSMCQYDPNHQKIIKYITAKHLKCIDFSKLCQYPALDNYSLSELDRVNIFHNYMIKTDIYNDKVNNLEKQLKNYNKLKIDCQVLLSKNEKLQNINILNDKIIRDSIYSSNENKIKDLEKEIIKLQNKEFSDNNLLLEKDTELYKLKQKFEELEIDYENIRQQNNDTQKILDKKKSGIYKLQNKVKEQDKQLKELEELLDDNLYTHFQELTESELNYKKLESEFNNLYSEKINLQELYNLQKNILILKVEKLELKKNETIYLQENMNMQLEDKDYISENKLLKNQINDQEEIIKQLLERIEILDREKNKNTLGNVLSNIFN